MFALVKITGYQDFKQTTVSDYLIKTDNLQK